MNDRTGLKIAVAGAGVAGLTAAYILQRKHQVTLFERNDYLGGHTNTVLIPGGPDEGTPVDTGFIVMNHRNYPLLTRLLNQLEVELRDSEMSFSYWDQQSGLQYSGSSLNTMFAQRRNLLRPRFYRMIAEIMRFYKEAQDDLFRANLGNITLGDYLKKGRYSRTMIRDHIIPMGAAIWSTPCAKMMEFPAESFLRFCDNHGLLSVNDRPQWRTVVNGSHTYVKAMMKDFTGTVRVKAPVQSIRRHGKKVLLKPEGAEEESFDAVVIGAHADEALAMLADPSADEKHLLGAWEYTKNRALLHTDTSVMPPIKLARASWNYTREEGTTDDHLASLTYDMNRLQGLKTEKRYFLSLNLLKPVPEEAVIREIEYDHPAYTRKSLDSQSGLRSLNGQQNTYFCGSYFGHGFHEDAVRSALAVATSFGLKL